MIDQIARRCCRLARCASRSSSRASPTPSTPPSAARPSRSWSASASRSSFPREQTCCGQLHLNAGYPDVAAVLAKRFVATFSGVRSSSSRRRGRAPRTCVRTYGEHTTDPGRDRDADARSSRSSSSTGSASPTSARGYAGTLTYHPTCHSLRGLRRRRRARIAAARGGRSRPETAHGRDRVLRLRRARSRCGTPRPRPRCWPTSCATRGSRRARRGVRLRRVVPPAHRRWARASKSAVRAVHLAEVLAA